MHEFIDVPHGHRQARLLVNIGLHEESIVSVRQHDGATNTVGKRNVSDEHRDHHFSRMRDLFKELAGLPASAIAR